MNYIAWVTEMILGNDLIIAKGDMFEQYYNECVTSHFSKIFYLPPLKKGVLYN